MALADIIQLAIFGVLTLSVILLVFQVRIQNRMFSAQLLRDRFEMYFRTYDPITKDHIDDFYAYTEDYMDSDVFKARYDGNQEAVRRYLTMFQLYDS